jgi:hypothetical protein
MQLFILKQVVYIATTGIKSDNAVTNTWQYEPVGHKDLDNIINV